MIATVAVTLAGLALLRAVVLPLLAGLLPDRWYRGLADHDRPHA